VSRATKRQKARQRRAAASGPRASGPAPAVPPAPPAPNRSDRRTRLALLGVFLLAAVLVAATLAVRLAQDDDGEVAAGRSRPATQATDGGSSGTATTAPGTTVAGSTPASVPPCPAPPPNTNTGQTTVVLTAQNLAFNTNVINVAADERVVIRLQNQDSEPHDLAIYTNGADRCAILEGEPAEPGKAALYTFVSPQAGTYQFLCRIHPLMTGTFAVS
jgi:plastocyanin